MSPVASGGPPHSRSTSVNVGGPVSTNSTTRMADVDTSKGNNRVYPHIDDLTSARPDFKTENGTIRRILQDAESLAKQADTHLDFRRPEIALQEYMKASILAAEIIPRHKDYPELKGHPDLHRAHIGLLKRINGQDVKFNAVIKTIKEDNLRTGVQPTRLSKADLGSERTTRVGDLGHARAQSVQGPSVNGNSLSGMNSTSDYGHANPLGISGVAAGASGVVQGRKKPPVQPKPDALHGNSIAPSNVALQSSQVDLAARFAKLRRTGSVPQNILQDSRIRTQPITLPNSSSTLLESPSSATSSKPYTTVRPTGPREFPSVPTSIPRSPKVILDLKIPDMPKPPDPIYSPASISDSTANNNLPSSISRGSSYLGAGRNNAAPPISRVGRTPSIPSIPDFRQDYFAAAHKVDNPTSQLFKKGPTPNISSDSTISAEVLFDYLRAGSKDIRLLVVDVRSREEFDAGHILAQSIICVEPIILQEGMSADRLEESMVLSPEAEIELFKQRHDFDVVVFYDQSSSSIKPRSSPLPGDNSYLHCFSKAVYDYGYDKQLKRRPKLLLGGVDAWVDIMGPGSLQSSSSGASSVKPAQTLGRVTIARDLRRNQQRKVTRMSVPFTKEEEKKWDDTITNLGSKDAMPDSGSEEFSYVRSTEDFLQRFPELPSIQESMVSAHPPHIQRNQFDDFHNGIPSPPARPAPALPRQRSSGLSERGPTSTYTSAGNTITSSTPGAGLTGIANFGGKTCYLSSVVQSLAATPVVYNFLNVYRYPNTPLPPKKAGEWSEPRQFLARNLQLLFKNLRSGQFKDVTPAHFWTYVRQLSSKVVGYGGDESKGFGNDKTQHDVQEFLNFLLDMLLDEVNERRDIAEWKAEPIEEAEFPNYLLMNHAINEWENLRKSNKSSLFDAFTALQVSSLKCNKCGASSRNWQPRNVNVVNIPEPSPGTLRRSRVSFKDLLNDRQNFGDFAAPAGWECQTCRNRATKVNNAGTTVQKIAYMPKYMIFYISRAYGTMVKLNTHIDLDLDHVDLAPIHLASVAGQQPPAGSDPGFQRPTSPYQAYACVMHSGTNIQAGHYVALTRDLDAPTGSERKDWHLFNDKTVTKTNLRSVENGYACGGSQFHMTLLFLKRKD